ncbi:MAG TPA: hypothetical protein VJT67_00530 [Longimicrobiaceae bacterium]|nr:hypothetical protein [Longimicrobiaceae bacterium]
MDTSVIGGCFDPEFEESSRELFRRFVAGEHILVLSSVTAGELAGAPEDVRNVVDQVPERYIERVVLLTEGERLANLYLGAGVIPRRDDRRRAAHCDCHAG